MSHKVINLTDENFDALVFGSPTPMIVEFYAPWCGPSLQMQSETARLVANSPGCRVGRLDIDANPHTPIRLGVTSIPATRVFNDDESAAALTVS